MLALLVDWGYRPDGIPVHLFDAWTTLPAGPATLAAKTGSLILPVTIRRQPDDTFKLSWADADRGGVVRSGGAPAGDPGDRRRARGHDRRGAGAVVQLQADLAGDGRGERRARAARRGSCRPGQPGPGPGHARRPRDRRVSGASADGSGRRPSSRRRGSSATCPRARRSAWPSRPATSGTASRPSAPRRRGATCGASASPSPSAGAADARSARPRPTRGRSNGSSARRSATTRATTSRSRGRRRSGPGDLEQRLVVETPEVVDAAFAAGGAVIFVGLHFGAIELPGAVPGRPGRRRRRADGDHRRRRAPGLVRADPRRGGHPHRRPPRGPPRAARRAPCRHPGRARRRPRPHRRRDAGRALRRARQAAARPGDARRRERGADLRRRRPAVRHRAAIVDASRRCRSRRRVRAGSGSRGR